MGITISLKPHIWARGSWPGEIEMNRHRDWDRFFESYERWMLHYALLAKMHRVHLLSVGVELSKVSVGQEHRWREMVGRLRGVCSGLLVYAANWGRNLNHSTSRRSLTTSGSTRTIR